jgi:hypothetical protein
MNNNTPLLRDQQRSSDDDRTYVEEEPGRENPQNVAREGKQPADNHLGINTDVPIGRMASLRSPSQNREVASRLDDDLALLQVERQISHEANDRMSHSRSVRKERSRHTEPIDEFDAATNPIHEKAAIYKPPEAPTNKVAVFFKKVHSSVWIVRYFIYITPLVLIILIPLLVGAFAYPGANVGGVKMMWFCIWLEIVWLTLWAGRVGRRVSCPLLEAKLTSTRF